jgi:hypothetical protein
MFDLASATALSITAVLVITELLKIVPVAFTSRYPAWVNGIVSFVAALIVVKPDFTFVSIGYLLGQLLFVSVVAALAYNQWVSRLKKTSTVSTVE